jgi:predicted metal-binding membrane protein
MTLLFFGGVMNLIWIGGIAIYVGIEKFAAGHRWLTIASGALLIVVGLEIVVRSFLAA